jgi:hypothetical protein
LTVFIRCLFNISILCGSLVLYHDHYVFRSSGRRLLGLDHHNDLIVVWCDACSSTVPSFDLRFKVL